MECIYKKKEKFYYLLIVALFVTLPLLIYIIFIPNKDNLYDLQWDINVKSNMMVHKDDLKNTKAIALENVFSNSIDDNSNFVSINESSRKVDIQYEKGRKLFKKKAKKRDILIAIIDTGIDINHYELKDSIYQNKEEIPNNNIDDDRNGYIDDYTGWNFVDNNNNILENSIESSHATHNAGTIVAKHNNGGIKGIAYDKHIKIMPIKILDNELSGKTSDLVFAINYALYMKADIINISLGTKQYNQNLDEIIREHNDTLFVIAAGNTKNGTNIDENKIFPASFLYDNVITVGNMDFNGDRFITSNYGKMSVDIFAPGTFILSTFPNDKFGYYTGSSMATPIVTGVASMMKAVNNNLSPKQIKIIIKNTATQLDTLKEICSSGGYINMYKAIEEGIKQ